MRDDLRNAEAQDELLQRLKIGGTTRRRANLVGELTERIRSFIAEGSQVEGQRLPTEAQICAAANVSRTVVREAMVALKAEGLIETRQGSGAFVRRPPDSGMAVRLPAPERAEDIVRLLEFRLAVETEMAFLAASRRTEADLTEMQRAADLFSDELAAGRDGVAADFAFHRALAKASQNGYFVAHLENLGSWALPRQRIPSELRKIVRDSGQIAQNDREHRAILAAVRDGDAQQAAAGMRLHLGESLMHYKALLAQ